MHWIDGARHVPNQFGSGEHGFTDGDPVSGVRGTVLTAKWLNDLQRNVIEVIKRGGTGSIADEPTDLYRAIQALIELAVPNQSIAVGTIMMFGGATGTEPGGWLLCDGSPKSRTGFAALFAAIGTIYGVGDNATTFNLPDLRGRMPLGAGQGLGLNNRLLGATGGEESHILTISEMPLHGHPVRRSNISQNDTQTQTIGGILTHSGGAVNDPPFTGTPADPGGRQVGGEGGGNAHNNMPPFVTVNFIIKH